MLTVYDVAGGEFAIHPNGDIEVIAGYPNVGAVFLAGTELHAQVTANLLDVPGNAELIGDLDEDEDDEDDGPSVGTLILGAVATVGAIGLAALGIRAWWG